jgi:hypothetical protein
VLFVVAGLWQDQNKSTLGAVHGIIAVNDPRARRTKLDSLWKMFVEWHFADVLLRHPNYHPRGGSSDVVYHPPIMDISTAAYDDVELILQRIDQELIIGKGMKAVLCVGDQQTFSRMWHLKVHAPAKYAWVIPCSGDFHYQFHVASGIHRVAYDSILKWFVDNADMSKTIKRRMDDTCHIKYIDHFYQLVIKSVLTYLTDVYGHEYMSKKPSEMLEEKKTHLGERVLLGPPPDKLRGGRSFSCLRVLPEFPWTSLILTMTMSRYSPRSPMMSSSGMSLY